MEPSELLQTVEALLRERKYHVLADIAKRVVWVFTTIDFTQDLGDQFGPPQIDDYTFTRRLMRGQKPGRFVLTGE